MDKSIRVRVLDRDYGLRVTEETEQATRDIAAYVDARMRAFRHRHPEQPELTAAVVTALAIAEELYSCREQHDVSLYELDEEISALSDSLGAVLGSEYPAEESSGEPEFVGALDSERDAPRFEPGV